MLSVNRNWQKGLGRSLKKGLCCSVGQSVMGECTYIVIDDGVNSIGNAFDSGSARIGEIIFLRACPFYN